MWKDLGASNLCVQMGDQPDPLILPKRKLRLRSKGACVGVSKYAGGRPGPEASSVLRLILL